MNPMVPSLSSKKTSDLTEEAKSEIQKMSSSEEDSKIDLLDDQKAITRKIGKVFCEVGNIEDNPLLTFVKMVLFPLHSNANADYQFEVERQQGGSLSFKQFEDLEKAFADRSVHPGDLKKAVIKSLDSLLTPIRQRFTDPRLVDITSRAYPNASANTNPKINPKINNNNNNFTPLDKKSNTNTNNTSNNNNKNNNNNASVTEPSPVSRLDLRVGVIKSAVKHADADTLYVEEIDVGDGPEKGLRTVVSGLAKYIPLDQMQGRRVVVVCNMKPISMRGIKSNGMVLAASNADHSQVELVEPPEGAVPGERIQFNEEHAGTPDEVLNPKKGTFEKAQADLKTTDDCVAAYKGVPFSTSKGVCKVQSLKGASIA